jgi:hypothetical protein
MGKVMNANVKYRQMRGRLDTSVIIGEPRIDGFGFSVYLEDSISGESSRFELFVKSEKEVCVTKDLVAITLAALTLKKYKNVYFDFDVGESALREAELLTGALVGARSVRADEPRGLRPNRSLNFSGGADSSALRLLCPQLPAVSVDFTGTDNPWETAERIRFAQENSAVVQTNAHEFLFPHYPIGYYNLGSLLPADSEGIGAAVDGRVMTDSERTFGFLEGLHPSALDLPDEVYGVKTLYPLIGMTRAGTQMIVTRGAADAASAFQASIGVGENNRRVLMALLDEAAGGENGGVDTADAAGAMPYGANPLLDFYALYFANRLGSEKASLYVKDIPREAVELAKSLSMDFYEKYDQRALACLPADFAEYFEGRLEACGVEFYTDEDYAEKAAVVEALHTGGGGL